MINRRLRKKLLTAGLTLTTAVSLIPGSVYAEKVESKGNELSWEEVEEKQLSDKELDASKVSKKEEKEASDISDDENVRVFIVFEGDSAVEEGYSTEDIADDSKAMNYADKLEKKQEKIVDTISEEALDGENLEVRYNYTILTNAVSAEVAYGDIDAIKDVDGVKDVVVVPTYEKLADKKSDAEIKTITSGDMVGSYKTWESGYTGAGMRIAVVDTGLDGDHPSFDSDSFEYGLKETAKSEKKSVSSYDLLNEKKEKQVLSKLNAKGLMPKVTAEDLYQNTKVPFAFNYVDENLDTTHDNDSQGDHGTHVAGIATANKYVQIKDKKGKKTYSKQESGVVGIAPDAQLFVMKVFGAEGGAYSDDYMAAIEDAILLGADTVNLSLGSSSAGNSSDGEEYVNNIFNSLVNTDTVVCISAGNSGSFADSSQYGANLTSDVNTDTVGSPGSYVNALTVASAVNSGYTAYNAVFDSKNTVYYADAATTNLRSLDKSGKGTQYDYVLLDGCGTVEDYENLDVKGKIVVVSRGEITFAEKQMNGEKAGASAVVIYNNTAGTIGMDLSNSSAKIPCVSITQADANSIREDAKKESDGVYSGKVTISSKVTTNREVPDGYTMSNFSSWGITGDLLLKPEITAPGGNIYSTIDKGEYGLMSGTSMASPSVSGMSALVMQYVEKNHLALKTGMKKRALVQSLLMSTSVPLKDKSGVEFSPREQGSGLANVYNATTTDSYILVGNKKGNDGKVKVELGDDPDKLGTYSFDFNVYNLSPLGTKFYELDDSILTAAVKDNKFISASDKKLSPKVTFKSNSLRSIYDLTGDGKFDGTDALNFATHLLFHSNAQINTYMDEFDFTKDGKVDKKDYNYYVKNVVKGKAKGLDTNRKVLAVSNSAKVSVTVTLTSKDRKYLDSNFKNGMYIEGYVYLNGATQLSVPMLAFYGDWSDSSMYEPYNYLDAVNNGKEYKTYCGINETNYITYKFAEGGSAYKYSSNLFSKDDEYKADRNAFSSKSGDEIVAAYYTLIRNAATVTATVKNAKTGEVYYENTKTNAIATFYSASSQSWSNTLSSIGINWKGTDADGKPLPEGTKVEVSVKAVPAYYKDAKDAKGKDTTITVPFVIDNSAPEMVSIKESSENKIDVCIADDRYAAVALIYANDKKTLLNKYSVNQKKAGEKTTLTIDDPKTVFYVTVVDYAGNSKMYRVNRSGEEDTDYATGVTLNSKEVNVLTGGTVKLEASVAPITVKDDTVTWTSSDEKVATVNEKGVVTGVAEGKATITATASALSSEGKAVSATCEVNVDSLDVSLNSAVWDENGEVFWSEFNSKDLTKIKHISEVQGNRYMSSAVVGDKILAATHGDNQKSDLYLVDPKNNYEATKLNTVDWCTDLAYSSTTKIAYGSCAYFIQLIDPATGELSDVLNLSKVTKDKYFVGITYAGSVNNSKYGTVDILYCVTESGEVYEIGYVPSAKGYLYSDLGNTGFNTNGQWYFNSLYYDQESGYALWSMYDNSDNAKLIALNLDNEEIAAFDLGQFPDSVYPVAALYSNNDFSNATAASENAKKGLNGEFTKAKFVKSIDKITKHK